MAMVEVYRAKNEYEAEIIKAILEDNGIRCVLDADTVGRIYGITIDGFGEVRVLTLPEDADRARKLISTRQDIPNERQPG